ncbi:MAG: alpha/beta fold hydrolase [Kiritimatiellae bacterium]|nr:alpha/beta fold hydrolase [Kiritimatiellia bacterium]
MQRRNNTCIWNFKRWFLLLIVTSMASISEAGMDHLFYYPDQHVYTTPDKDGFFYEEVSFPSKDGTKLSGWFVPAQKDPKGTVIHFHGNAQNMSSHYSFVSWLPSKGFNLFVFDYRGYGKSRGTPSRKGVYEDSVAAVKYIKTRKDIDQNKIILFGQSLGGANAISVLVNNHFDGVQGLVTDSAFSSYKEIAMDHAGIFLKPIAFLAIGNQFSPKDVVQKISPIPLLIIHGTSDEVVSYKHAQTLFKAANEPKQLWTLQAGRHTEALLQFKADMIPKLLAVFTTWINEKSIVE